MGSDKALLGKLAEADAQKDAIHVAIAPVVAGETLWPSQRIQVINGKAMSGGTACGIVDPFLMGAVYEGQQFYVVLFPGSITSLRHDWTHPAFVKELPTLQQVIAGEHDPKEASRRFITDLGDSVGISYSRIMSGAEDWVAAKARGAAWGEYIIGGSEMEGECVPEVWNHYEVMTGIQVPEDHRGSFFSCSCSC